MADIREGTDRYLDHAEASYRVSRRWVGAIIVFPLLIDFFALVFLRIDATRPAARWAFAENRPVEVLTFLFLMIGAVWALVLCWQAVRNAEKASVYVFYALFALGLLVVGMEEISWGQQFLNFETFEAFMEVNRQGEVSLHNIGQLQGNSAYFRLVFGLGGLLGVWLSSRNIWRKITPPQILLTWFLVITFFAALGIYKNVSGDTRLYDLFSLRHLSELNEMLIGLSAFLFIWLNMRRFRQAWSLSDPTAGDESQTSAAAVWQL